VSVPRIIETALGRGLVDPVSPSSGSALCQHTTAFTACWPKSLLQSQGFGRWRSYHCTGFASACVFHRITECFGLEGTVRGDLVQPLPAVGRGIFSQIRLLRAPSNLALTVPRDEASTTPLGSLCQPFTTLTALNFFLNPSSVNLKPLPLVLDPHALVKSPSPPFF